MTTILRGNDTPNVGALLVARADAGARAVAAEEALRRAEALATGTPAAIMAARELARASFASAFHALDAVHAVIHAASPRDANPVRHRADVAFILRHQLKHYEDLWAGRLAVRHLAHDLGLGLMAIGGTVAEIMLERYPAPAEDEA